MPIAPSVLDRVGVLRTARARHHHPFHPHPLPGGLALREVCCWAFAPDGRVLVLLDPVTGAASLPGGTPEPEDRRDPAATLVRGAREEAAAEVAGPVCLGYLSDPDGPCARVRLAAGLTRVGVPPIDPATGRAYVRVLATPEQALCLFDWGPAATDQLAAVHRARAHLGIPRALRRSVTELPGHYAW